MSLKKDFYTNNFSSFIILNKKFFKAFEPSFVKIFSEYTNKLSSSKLQNIQTEIKEFYNTLFITPFFEKNTLQPSKELKLINRLTDYNIDYKFILNKVFLITANSYIKYIIKEKNSLPQLKTMTFLLDFYIRYIDFHFKNTSLELSTEIPAEIKEIFKSKKPLNLFTIYKGIPIAHKTNILEIDDKEGVIKVTANNYQIVAAKFHKEIFLLENDKEYSFRANIKHYVIHNKTMYLDNIEKVQRNAPKRSFIRVQPKEKIEVVIKKDRQNILTELYDISLRGLCVLGNSRSLNVSDIITLEFILKLKKPYLITTQGEIKSITKLDSKTYRYHIHFELSTHYEYILSKYITKREKEIVKELNYYISEAFIALSE
jgi:hypothetical protein